MKPYAVVLALAMFMLASCSKAPDVQPNIQTTISGRFYDVFNQEAYPNLKVKIGEYQLHTSIDNGSYYTLIGYRDSTTTDVNGNYTITFTTSGKGSSYFIEFKGIPSNIDVDGAIPGEQRRPIDALGRTNAYNFNVHKTYYMQARIIVNNNPYQPLAVTTGNDHFYISGANNKISKANNDTVEFIPIQKNSGGFYLYFSITNPATNITYSNPKILLNPVINTDTIQGGTYNLFPGTFK